MGQAQAAMLEQVQEQVVAHAPPPPVLAVVLTVTLPADAVTRLLNLLEALVPTHGRPPVSQIASQTQIEVHLNVAAPQTPEMVPQQVVQPVAAIGHF